MRFATKGTKFDPNNMKSFEEIYSNVESNCAVLRDMDEIVQEQGIGELPTGFKSLDLDYDIGKPRDHLEKRQPRREPRASVLPLIRAAAADSSPTRMTDKEIDEITEGLDKLHIL